MSRDVAAATSATSATWKIFLVSVLGLFVELLLIRWIGTEIRIFAYLQNTVLVVCFLGLGMGCFTCRRPIHLHWVVAPLVALAGSLAVPWSRQHLRAISERLSVLHDTIWQSAEAASAFNDPGAVAIGVALTALLMGVIWAAFVPLGRILGRLMDDHPRTILAYSVNIAGSLVGTWLFVVMSVFNQPPVTWFVVAAVLALPFLPRSAAGRIINVGLLVALVVCGYLASRESAPPEQKWQPREVTWSPYQKLSLWSTSNKFQPYMILVNNTGYQGMLELRPEKLPPATSVVAAALRGHTQYDLPYVMHGAAKKALIVGAGSGNDAAGALRNGVTDIVAVEIDPVILSMGRRHHPEEPYDSPRVRMVIDDARSYFAACEERFDVISFGLLDSHTTTSMTNARLDHYVYTRESLARAKSLLNEGGLLVLSFEVRKPYIADRMARTLRDVFGREPFCFRIPHTGFGWGGTLFIAGDLDRLHQRIEASERLKLMIGHLRELSPVEPTYTTPVATDDWPYIYLDHPRIPTLYFLLAGLMVVLFFVFRTGMRMGGGEPAGRWSRVHLHFFLLGAAFMLLEVQNISKASVVLGNTWWVNAVIISGVLLMVLVANALAARFPAMPMRPVYVGLCASCVALYFVDLSTFGFLPYATKALVIGGLTTLPMLFSGLVFIRSFARVAGKDRALGANLFGALVGALLQTVTFLTGIKALLLIVTALYVAALLTRPATAAVEKAGDG